MHVTAIIAAGGRGTRFGGALKQLHLIGGRAILDRSVSAFLAHPAIAEVIVALPQALVDDPPGYLRGPSLRLVSGGERRQDSVANAFHRASPESDVIVIHDAARPCVRADLIARTNVEGTDEAALAERAGHPVRLVEGDATNVKITTPEDLAIAEALAAAERPAPFRTGRAGTGYDLHRLSAGRPLIVGGVTIPSDRGAVGHSDADVACHAITDAILGAAGLGDIGEHFPDSDPRWKGASSLDLLARASRIVRDGGYEIGNVDVTVILEAPKIRDHVDAMRRAIAAAIGIDAARVSVKGKTNEDVDAIGRGEAIAAHAVALIRIANC